MPQIHLLTLATKIRCHCVKFLQHQVAFSIMGKTEECREAVLTKRWWFICSFPLDYWGGPWFRGGCGEHHQLRSPVWHRGSLSQLLSRGHIAAGNMDSRHPGNHRSGSTSAAREKNILRTKLKSFFEGSNHMQPCSYSYCLSHSV